MPLRILRRAAISIVLSALAVFGLTLPASAAITGTTVVGSYASGPRFAAYSPDGRYSYLTFPDTDQLIRYDTQTGTSSSPVTFAADTNPYEVQVSPDGQRLYVTLQGVWATDSGGLAEIDAATMTVTRTIPIRYDPGSGQVTTGPTALVLSPDGTHAYVFESVRDYVARVNLITGTVVAETALYYTNGVGPIPQMAITPDGSKLFVTQNFTFGSPFSQLSMINTTNFSAVPTVISPGSGILNLPSGIAIAPDGSKMYVTNTGDDYVNIFDPSTNAYLGHVLVQNANTTALANALVAVSPDSSQFVVSNTAGYGQYLFYSVETNALLYSHSINPSSATGGMTDTIFSPNGAQLMTVIYNDYGFVLYAIDPALGVKKPALAATGTNAAPMFIGAGILVVLGAAAFVYAVVLRTRHKR